jgi:hypothetical protein
MHKLRISDFRDFGWEIAHAAVTRRPPISLYTMVPRTESYAYAVGVWDLSIVQGPFSVAPVPNPSVTIRQLFRRCEALHWLFPQPLMTHLAHPRGSRGGGETRREHQPPQLRLCPSRRQMRLEQLRNNGAGPLRLPLRHGRVVLRVEARLHHPYGDEKFANRDTRVWHGATETGP